MSDTLTIEIVKRIMSNLGLVSGNKFGKVGLTTKELIISQTILFEDTSGAQEQELVYAGQIIVNNNENIKAACVNLSTDNFIDFALVIKLNDLPTYGLRLKDKADFLIMKNNMKSWQPTNILTQSKLLVGIEYITDEGFLWQPCNNCDDVYSALDLLVE